MRRPPFSREERDQAFKHWRDLGFSGRHARVLMDLGYVSVDDLKNATDLDLRVLPGIAREGLVLIYRLIGRESPLKLKSKAEVRAEFERAWRASIDEDRINRLLDEIAAMVGDALDRANQQAAEALWGMARRRRAGR